MSTRSYIAEKINENTYRAVYCHYDGYLEYNGRMLLEHYNTEERVKKLLDLGCISSLREKPEPEAGSHARRYMHTSRLPVPSFPPTAPLRSSSSSRDC